MYRHYAQLQGARLIEVQTLAEQDFAIDVDEVLRAWVEAGVEGVTDIGEVVDELRIGAREPLAPAPGATVQRIIDAPRPPAGVVFEVVSGDESALERELRRKEAALAETAALLTLSKKAQAIWGDNEA